MHAKKTGDKLEEIFRKPKLISIWICHFSRNQQQGALADLTASLAFVHFFAFFRTLLSMSRAQWKKLHRKNKQNFF